MKPAVQPVGGPAGFPPGGDTVPGVQTTPRWRPLRAVVALLATLLLLGLALRAVDLHELPALGADLAWPWLLLAAAFVPVEVALAALRWRHISTRLGQPLPVKRAVSEYALSTLLNGLLPAGVGGDAVRVWRQRQTKGLRGALRAAIVDRWTGQACLAVVALGCAAAWTWLAPSVPRPAGLLPVLVLTASAVLLLPALPARLPLVGALARDARAGALGAAPVVVLLSVALIASFFIAFQACAMALGRPLGIELWLAPPILLVAMALPIGVGGWGPRELGAVTLLPLFGWSETEAFALSALYGLSFLLGSLPGALVPLLALRPKPGPA